MELNWTTGTRRLVRTEETDNAAKYKEVLGKNNLFRAHETFD